MFRLAGMITSINSFIRGKNDDEIIKKVYVSSDIISRYPTTDEPYCPYPGWIDHRRKAKVMMDGVKVNLIEVKYLDNKEEAIEWRL